MLGITCQHNIFIHIIYLYTQKFNRKWTLNLNNFLTQGAAYLFPSTLQLYVRWNVEGLIEIDQIHRTDFTTQTGPQHSYVWQWRLIHDCFLVAFCGHYYFWHTRTHTHTHTHTHTYIHIHTHTCKYIPAPCHPHHHTPNEETKLWIPQTHSQSFHVTQWLMDSCWWPF